MSKIKVGDIVNTHGIKGELKIQRTGVETFDRDIDYYIGKDNIKVNIERSKIHKGFFIVKLKNYNNINDVLKFKNQIISISKEDLQELNDDEFYINDLIDLDVYEDDQFLGKIIDVLEYNANDIYIVKTEGKEIMIPAVGQFIKNIDIESNRIDVKLIEGMK